MTKTPNFLAFSEALLLRAAALAQEALGSGLAMRLLGGM
jgi:hypothetical protein